MAGIVGTFRAPGQGEADRTLLVRQTELLAARGPDDGAVYLEGPYGLGHRRLDAEGTGHQPHWDEESRVAVLVDADLLNREALAQTLASKGHRLGSDEPAEVILAAYREWGDSFLERLEGTYALAVLDRKARSLFLARDPSGGRPLFYHRDRRRFTFASNLATLVADPATPRTLDPDAVVTWFSIGYVPAPDSLLKEVRSVVPGEALLVTEEGVRSRRRGEAASLALAPEARLSALRSRLEEASTAAARGATGLALSGGRVSSALLAWIAGADLDLPALHLVGFDPEDRRAARRLVGERGWTPRELRTRGAPLSLLRDAVGAMELPVADPWFVTQYALGRALRGSHSVEGPIVTGHGGREMTAETSTRSGLDALRRELSESPAGRAAAHRAAEASLPERAIGLAGPVVDALGVVAERAIRAPMLSPSVLELRGARPDPGRPTWARLARGSVPGPVAAAPGRRLGPPLAAWLRGPAQRWAEEELFGPEEGSAMVDRGRLRRWWYGLQLRVQDRSEALWRALVFEAWYRGLLDPSAPARRRRR